MKDHISQSDLNREFLSRLRARHAEMDSFVEESDDGDYVKVVVPPPDGQEEALTMTTCGGELTMSYHQHHSHWHVQLDGDAWWGFDEFFDYVDSFLNEERVAACEVGGTQWYAGDARADQPIAPQYGGRVVVRSWLGTHSRTVE